MVDVFYLGTSERQGPEKVSTTRNLGNQLATLLKNHQSVEKMFNHGSYDILVKMLPQLAPNSKQLQRLSLICHLGGHD